MHLLRSDDILLPLSFSALLAPRFTLQRCEVFGLISLANKKRAGSANGTSFDKA
jgi:hypothetical protein